ncbi:MAG: dephospho-CoA kinase [Actinomycetales bacterium]|nr:dephospho-CoA kinase [Actinomycetales bacterium]
MFLIGLTGGIAAGKSTVAELWRKLGAFEVDADALAREAVAQGTPGLAAVVAEFGPEVLDDLGQLNRKALGSIVFSDEHKRKTLESIVHPIVRKLADRRFKEISAEHGESAIVIYSIPLLAETDSDLPFDEIVTVEAPEEKQIDRMIKHRGMTKEEASARIRSQASPIQRAIRADHILNSNQELSLLLRDAEQLFHEFEQRAAAKVGQGDVI